MVTIKAAIKLTTFNKSFYTLLILALKILITGITKTTGAWSEKKKWKNYPYKKCDRIIASILGKIKERVRGIEALNIVNTRM